VARIVAQVRGRWPKVKIIIRADSGFARDEIMSWCEESRVDYVLGPSRNPRLVASIKRELVEARAKARESKAPARRFKDFSWATLDSWGRKRRVLAKAEWTSGKANPRFVVTSLKKRDGSARFLYEKLYCARGDMENRIKECQIDMFADRTPASTMRTNQLRLWFASFYLRAGVRAPSHRARWHTTCASLLRHDPPEASQERREGHRLGAAPEARARLRPPFSPDLLHRRRSSPKRHSESTPSASDGPSRTPPRPPQQPRKQHRFRAASAATASHGFCTARSKSPPRNRRTATLREKAGLAAKPIDQAEH
jgi:hypothetical protein